MLLVTSSPFVLSWNLQVTSVAIQMTDRGRRCYCAKTSHFVAISRVDVRGSRWKERHQVVDLAIAIEVVGVRIYQDPAFVVV